MALVDISATGADDVLNLQTDQETIETDLAFRDKQLIQLKEEVLDLEDPNENISLNEFVLDDFRLELMKYIRVNRQLLENTPSGIFAMVPIPENNEYSIIRPSVIFCFRQKVHAENNRNLNPLSPYFLLYIRQDGEVRLTFNQPKQILEMYRYLCGGQAKPHDDLCLLFDQKTDHGRDMSVYNQLLQQAIGSLSQTFKRRVVTHLLSGRGSKVPKVSEQVHNDDDLELITWLVIQ